MCPFQLLQGADDQKSLEQYSLRVDSFLSPYPAMGTQLVFTQEILKSNQGVMIPPHQMAQKPASLQNLLILNNCVLNDIHVQLTRRKNADAGITGTIQQKLKPLNGHEIEMVGGGYAF